MVRGEAEAVLRQGAELLENRSRSLPAALLLNRGPVGEASDLVRRLHAIGDEHVRVFVEDPARSTSSGRPDDQMALGVA